MLRRLVDLKDAVEAALVVLSGSDPEWMRLSLGLEEWTVLTQLNRVLLYPFQAITLLEGEHYPTIGSALPAILGLQQLLSPKSDQNPLGEDWSNLPECVEQVRDRILKQICLPERFRAFPSPVKFSCILDPRSKHLEVIPLLWLEACFEQLQQHMTINPPAPSITIVFWVSGQYLTLLCLKVKSV